MFRCVCKANAVVFRAAIPKRFTSSQVAATVPESFQEQKFVNCSEAVGKLSGVRRFGSEKQYLRMYIRDSTFEPKEEKSEPSGFEVSVFHPGLVEQLDNVAVNTTVFVQGKLEYRDYVSETGESGAKTIRKASMVANNVSILSPPSYSITKKMESSTTDNAEAKVSSGKRGSKQGRSKKQQEEADL